MFFWIFFTFRVTTFTFCLVIVIFWLRTSICCVTVFSFLVVSVSFFFVVEICFCILWYSSSCFLICLSMSSSFFSAA